MIWSLIYIIGFLGVFITLTSETRWDCVRNEFAEFCFIVFLCIIWPILAAGLLAVCAFAFIIPLFMEAYSQLQRFLKRKHAPAYRRKSPTEPTFQNPPASSPPPKK